MGIKKQLVWLTIILLLLAGRVNASGDACEIINTGKWTIDELNVLIVKASKIKDSSLRIDFISRQFLGLPYQEKTLVGGVQAQEVLTINLAGVDCFTLLDYVEAMQLSASSDDFNKNLKKIRYQSGIVDYQRRNHFFTDWIEFNSNLVTDVIKQIDPANTRKVTAWVANCSARQLRSVRIIGKPAVLNHAAISFIKSVWWRRKQRKRNIG